MFLASVLEKILHPCIALALRKLLTGCGWAMAAACSWGGRISLTVCFLCVFALRCCGETSHKQFGFALLCSSSNEGRKHLTVTLFLHLLVDITAWKTSQDYSMCLSHPAITSAHPYIQNISKHSSWNRSLAFFQPYNWIFGYRSVIVGVIVQGHGKK